MMIKPAMTIDASVPVAVVAALLTRAITGVPCAILPARRTARVDPVDALRYG